MSSPKKRKEPSDNRLTVTKPPKKVSSKTGAKSKSSTRPSSGKSTPKTSVHMSSKVTINSSVTEDLNKTASNVGTELPSISNKPAKYKPIPYTFRIPSNTNSLINGRNFVKCPPFYIQLDHVLAVVWSLFSIDSTEKLLGIAQLQWALNFLKGVRNKKGKHPKDVAVCIDAMEEALIQQYAEMANTSPRSCCKCKCFGKSKSSKTASLASINKSNTIVESRTAKIHDESQLVTQKLPFSVTYAEMSKHRPNHVEQLFKAKSGISMTAVDIQRQLDNLKQVIKSANSGISLGPTYSKENMVELLKVCRKEQINKLQDELQRLHSIETFIGNLDKDNFKPYLDNQELDVLVTQKVKTDQTTRTTHSISSYSSTQTSKKHSPRTTRTK